MANPIKAIKAVTRVVGGITGKGSKQVNPVYKNMDLSKAEAKANKRGLKAANKPVSKKNRDGEGYLEAYEQYYKQTGKDTNATTPNLLKFSKPARPNRVRGGSMGSKVNWPKGMK
jgi:hypothetical protein